MTLDIGIPKISGCIFDFDGTIILSEHVHMKAWEDLANDLQKSLPTNFLEQSVGMSDPQLVKILARAWENAFTEKDILEKKRHFYMMRCISEVSTVPGVIAFMDRLQRIGMPMAIATSSARCEVEPVLHRLGLTKKFQGICTVEDVTHPKPHPEIYICAARRLGLKPLECLAFEDSIAGVTSARAAGCSLVAVETLYNAERLAPALISIKDFLDSNLDFLLKSIEH